MLWRSQQAAVFDTLVSRRTIGYFSADLGQACKDNNFPCIWITEDKIFENIVQTELDRLLMEKVDTETTEAEILDDFNKIKSGEASRMSQKDSNK